MILSAIEPVLALSATQRAVRDVFTRGGSTIGVLLTLLGLVGMVVLAYVLSELLHRARVRLQRPNCAKKLFRDLLEELELTDRQRKFLVTVAKQRSMAHPTAMLLSREIFDQAVGAAGRTSAGRTGAWARTASEVREALFPGEGSVQRNSDEVATDPATRRTANQ